MNLDTIFLVIGQVVLSLGGASVLLLALLKFYGDYIFKKELAKFQAELKSKSDWFSALINAELSKVQAAASRIDVDRSNGIKEIFVSAKHLSDKIMCITDFERPDVIQKISVDYQMNYVGNLRAFASNLNNLYAPFEYSITSNSLFLSKDIAIQLSGFGLEIFKYIACVNEMVFGAKVDAAQLMIIDNKLESLKSEYRESIRVVFSSLSEALRKDLYPEVARPKE